MIRLTNEQQLVQMARIKICEECGLKSARRCPDCGCFMDLKTRMMGASCPRGKWEAMSPEDVIEFSNNLIDAMEIE